MIIEVAFSAFKDLLIDVEGANSQQLVVFNFNLYYTCAKFKCLSDEALVRGMSLVAFFFELCL